MSFDITANLVTRDAVDGHQVFDFLPGTEELGVNMSSRSCVRIITKLGFACDPEEGFGHADAHDFRDALAALPREEDDLLRQYLGDLTILVESAVCRSAFAVISWG